MSSADKNSGDNLPVGGESAEDPVPPLKVLFVGRDSNRFRTTPAYLTSHPYSSANTVAEAKKILAQEPYQFRVVCIQSALIDDSVQFNDLTKGNPWPLKVIILSAPPDYETRGPSWRKLASETLIEGYDELQLQKAFEAADRDFAYDAIMKRLPGCSAVWKEAITEAALAIQSDEPVLILGETGSGKSTLAQLIHSFGPYGTKKMISVYLGEGLAKDHTYSALFGHLKGAYTGAVRDRDGAFAQGNHSTVFIDEIGELPLEHQPLLLTVLNEKVYHRMGENKLSRFSGRVILATNRDPARMVRQKTFRDDLYFRIQGQPINVPPLRHRREDLDMLIKALVPPSMWVSDECRRFFESYPFPGNINQLKKMLEVGKTRARGRIIELHNIPPAARQIPVGFDNDDGMYIEFPEKLLGRTYPDAMAWLEDRFIRAYLPRRIEEGKHVKGDIAKLCGFSEVTLRAKMRQLNDKKLP